MTREIPLPELGENLASAVVLAVRVSPGDLVRRDQALLEVEADKATIEVPSPFGGVVREVRVREGEEIRVGAVITRST